MVRSPITQQVQECLRPFGLFRLPDTPAGAIATNRGGIIHLHEGEGVFTTRIERWDGLIVEDVRPIAGPGELAIAIRVLVFKARA